MGRIRKLTLRTQNASSQVLSAWKYLSWCSKIDQDCHRSGLTNFPDFQTLFLNLFPDFFGRKIQFLIFNEHYCIWLRQKSCGHSTCQYRVYAAHATRREHHKIWHDLSINRSKIKINMFSLTLFQNPRPFPDFPDFQVLWQPSWFLTPN
jgi:hypothetical protein